ncbi:MAG: DUF4097 domain-containing protein [Gammaproteobacteria bacterium]|nr:DUF4097 domain-containing protein [Gammaproteobacteria bacterium]
MQLRFFSSAVLILLVLTACSDQAGPVVEPQAAANQLGPDPAMPTDPDQDFKLTSFKWDGPMQAGERLRVRNPYGDIRCRKSGTQELVVSAQIQTFTDWQPAPEVEVVETNGNFEIRISHPHPARAQFGGDYDKGFAGRIDLAVLLPAGTAADFATTDGVIRVKGFNGDLVASTGSGEMYYKASGSFDLGTESGAVEATISDFAPDRRGEIHTTTGSVSLWLAANGAATVEADSAGTIEFRAGDDVRAEEKRADQSLQVLLGGGGRHLKINSESGIVTILAD